jgi:EmrB/QacA subfamily drug resistance transporter
MSAPTRREIRAIIFGLTIVLALGALDQSIVSTALPRIVSEFGGISRLTWVVTAYVLAATSVMPLYGKLSDQYGRKPMIYVAVLTFLAGSALCGAAQSLTQLILFRVIQGLGAGGLLPLSQTIIGDLVPPSQRGRKQGLIVAVFGVCSIVGPVLGGVITDALSWHWIFFVNLPVGALALAVIAKSLPAPTQLRAHRIDYLGSALLTACTTALLLILTLGGASWRWASVEVGGLSAVAALTAILFVVHLRRAPEPVLPLDLFRNRLFVVACTVLAFTSMGLLGVSVFFPIFFQIVMGASPADSGFLTGPLMIGFVISSLVNGHFLLRSGRYKPAQIAGLSTAVAAFAALAWGVATSQPLAVIEPSMLVLGLGLGLVTPNMTIAVQNALPPKHRGVGTATLAFFRSLGGLVGVAASGAIFTYHLQAGADVSSSDLYRHAIALTFVAGVCVVAVALAALLFLPELPLRHHTDDPSRPASAAKDNLPARTVIIEGRGD